MATNSLPADAIILVGPTASGKTHLLDTIFGEGADSWIPRLRSLWHADLYSAQVISADSMQAYRFMNIGTAKPSQDLLKRLPHHLIDIKNPNEQYTAGEFVERADTLCSLLKAQGILPIVSGGTGYYLMNFICGLPSSPPSSRAIRAQVAKDLEIFGAQALREELAKTDPKTAARIHERDIYRLTRAVEILRASGKPPSLFAPLKTIRSDRHFLLIGMTRSREELHTRIHERVEAMMMEGLASENEKLKNLGYNSNDPGLRAIGYREFFELEGEPIERIANAIELHTRQYAKRQMTFFRALPGLIWIEPYPEDFFRALKEIGLRR